MPTNINNQDIIQIKDNNNSNIHLNRDNNNSSIKIKEFRINISNHLIIIINIPNNNSINSLSK